MKYMLKAVSFLNGINSDGTVHYRGERYSARMGNLESDIYRPESPEKTVLIVHGMAPDGYRDHRSIRICESLARCGFLAVSPRFPEIEDLVITTESIDNIKKAIRDCAGDRELSPSGKVGIMSASLSAGMSLIAASDEAVAPLVSSVCLLGSYCNVEDILAYVFERDIVDDYGRMLILKNFHYPLAKPGSRLGGAFATAAQDNYYLREEPHLPSYLEGLDDDERELFRRLRNDRKFMCEARKKLANHYEEFLHSLSVIPFLHSLKAPVTLIHGKDDPVIPSEQSQMIHDELKKLGKESRVCLSPLISHSNLTLGVSLVAALFMLIYEFARFFKKA